MTVSTFRQPDSTTQSVIEYATILDGDISVMARVAAAFAPHESSPADLTITVDPGPVFDGVTLTELSAQTTSTISPPSADPRIDRIVMDRLSGMIDVVTGTESAAPTPPDIPSGFAPIARVQLSPSSTAITNAMISDERAFLHIGVVAGSGGLLDIQTFTASGIYTPTPGTRSVIVEVLGGGGSGGGCAAPSSGQCAAGSGGGAGAFAKGRFVSGFAGVSVTVGSGGAATSTGAVDGNAGSSSSFGSLIVAPGGKAGRAGPAVVGPDNNRRSDVSAPPTGGNIIGSVGATGDVGVVLSATEGFGGSGGNSVYGAGSFGSFGGDGSNADANSGSGGGGASSPASGPARSGGAGGSGLVIVYEYS